MDIDERSPMVGLMIGMVSMLITSQIYNMSVIGEFPVVRFVSIPLLGVGYWGIPLPWLKQVVYPGSPKEVIAANALSDMAFWVAVALFVQMSYIALNGVLAGQKKARPRRKASRRLRGSRKAGKASRRRRR